MLFMPYTIPGGVACIDRYGPLPGADHKEISFINFWDIFWNIKTWIITYNYSFRHFQVYDRPILAFSLQGSGSYTWFTGDPGSGGQGQGQTINTVKDLVCCTNTANMFAITTVNKCLMTFQDGEEGQPIQANMPGVRGLDLRSREGKYYVLPLMDSGSAAEGPIYDPTYTLTRTVGQITSSYLQVTWPIYGIEDFFDGFANNVFTWPACSWTIEPLEFWDWVTYT